MYSARSVAILILVTLVSFTLAAQEQSRRALVVGNAEYEHFDPLQNPRNDAVDVAQSLRELGFEVTTVLNADHRTLFGRIRDFGDELAREPGVGLFYYAGHAIEVDGTNYLIPTDADIRAQDEVEFASVPLDLVLSKMESAANPTNVIVLDACRDNPLPATARSAGGSRGLTVVQAPPGSLIVYATEPGSTADDGQGRNSPFTDAFLSHVATPGLDIELMFRNVRRQVIESTAGRQIPWTNSSLTTSLAFADGPAAGLAAVPAPAPAPRGEAGSSPTGTTGSDRSTIRGALSISDPTGTDGSHIDWHEVPVTAGMRTLVTLSSSEFDTYLRVDLPDGQSLYNDDDSGTDSALSFMSDSDGTMRIGATSYGAGSTGSYTVRITPIEERAIRVGERVSGDLQVSEDIYLLSGTPGENVVIELRSSYFDTYLELEDDDGAYLYNDDAEGTTRSRIVHQLNDRGEALVTVSSWGSSGGPYELVADRYSYEGPRIPDGYELSDDEAVDGTIGPHLPSVGGSYSQRFTFRGEPGERVEIVLRSSDFDSYLRVVAPDGRETSDDDSAGNLDSRVIMTTNSSGDYDVYASDLGGGSTGAYTLTFARLAAARELLRTSGALTRDDPIDISGKYYDVHQFEVTAGRLVVVDVISDDFDGYAIVRGPDGALLHRDDDGGGSGNPRVVFTAERSGTLELVVTTYAEGSTGSYEVVIGE